ncbi:MAG TPA: aldo/keto reductase [Thermoplasmata archaeon]
MQYRDFGRIDWRVSALGFGCMRLPTHDKKAFGGKIRERESVRMIRYAIDRGVNYLDTAYGYHEGRSEALVREALRGEYREKVRVATKSPVWLVEKPSDFDKYLNRQMKRLGTKRIDFYLFHGLNKETWKNTVLKHKLLKRAEAARKDGRIAHLGFSFHDKYDAFKEIVDGHDGWDFCQIQYNYMDILNQAGTKGLKYAARNGLGVVIMEPLLGGRLANPPRSIREIIRRNGVRRAPADLALQWIWNQPEVSLILSGMSTMGQVRQNIRSASSSGIDTVGDRELRLVDLLRSEYQNKTPISCTKCGYCMPCPNGVDIPENFELYNDGFIHDDVGTSRMLYSRFFSKKRRASACKQCGKCEKRCPQGLPISQLMPRVHSVLGEGKPYCAN